MVGDFRIIRNGRKELRQKSHRTGISCWATVMLLAAVSSGCEHLGRARPVPLYPNPTAPRPPESLAHLQGPIAEVDGIDVEPYGTVFDLLPGCHVVTLRRKVGEGSVSGAWMADLGTVIYTFHMRPGFLYTIDVSARFRGSSHGSLTITAEERDPCGALVSRMVPVQSWQDVEACEDSEAAATLPMPERGPVYPAPSVPTGP